MNKSKFSTYEKLSILDEAHDTSKTISEICFKHKISLTTFYLWRKQLKRNGQSQGIEQVINNSSENNSDNLYLENKELRKLYIDLSEHNYKLAQFLSA